LDVKDQVASILPATTAQHMHPGDILDILSNRFEMPGDFWFLNLNELY
jgi:hypothetical protein